MEFYTDEQGIEHKIINGNTEHFTDLQGISHNLIKKDSGEIVETFKNEMLNKEYEIIRKDGKCIKEAIKNSKDNTSVVKIYNKHEAVIKETELDDVGFVIREKYYDKTGNKIIKEVTNHKTLGNNKVTSDFKTITVYDKDGNIKYTVDEFPSALQLSTPDGNERVFNGLKFSHTDIKKILEYEKKLDNLSYDELLDLFVQEFKDHKKLDEIESRILKDMLKLKCGQSGIKTGYISDNTYAYLNNQNKIMLGKADSDLSKIDLADTDFDFAKINPSTGKCIRFRGEQYDKTDVRYNEYLNIKENDVFENKLYTWVTNDPSTASGYSMSSDKSIIHIIKLPEKSTHCIEHRMHSTNVNTNTMEMVIDKNAKFKVLRKEVNEDGNILIISEYISPQKV